MVPNKPKDYALKFAIGFGVAVLVLIVLGFFGVTAMEISVSIFGAAGYVIGFALIMAVAIGAKFALDTDAHGNTYRK
jgi:hypothetical protein